MDNDRLTIFWFLIYIHCFLEPLRFRSFCCQLIITSFVNSDLFMIYFSTDHQMPDPATLKETRQLPWDFNQNPFSLFLFKVIELSLLQNLNFYLLFWLLYFKDPVNNSNQMNEKTSTRHVMTKSFNLSLHSNHFSGMNHLLCTM